MSNIANAVILAGVGGLALTLYSVYSGENSKGGGLPTIAIPDWAGWVLFPGVKLGEETGTVISNVLDPVIDSSGWLFDWAKNPYSKLSDSLKDILNPFGW